MISVLWDQNQDQNQLSSSLGWCSGQMKPDRDES